MEVPPTNFEKEKPKVSLCFKCGWKVDPLFQVYFLLALAQVILYAETGAVPSLLVDLTKDFNLTFTEQGYLGGTVYAGIACGAPFTSMLVTRFEPRSVLIWSITINAMFTVLFGLTPLGWSRLLITIRWFIGFTQATLAVFCPVWVDRFATKGNKGKWFAILQVTIPLGVMAGYLLGWGANGLQNESEGSECFGDSVGCWRFPFVLQGIVTIPLVIGFMSVKHEYLDIGGGREDKDTRLEDNMGCFAKACFSVKQYFYDLWTIVTQFYFTSVVILITTMYFVLVSIQYWATAWMIVGREYNENAVMGWFIFCSATGPTGGAIFGGWFVDYLGGYIGSLEQRRYSVGVMFAIYTCGCAFTVGTTMWVGGGLAWVVFCLWTSLFCGGCVVPALTGMYTAAIPTARLKILGSSLMLVVISIFAYFLCPVIAGYLMTQFNKDMPECLGYNSGKCPAALERGFAYSLNMSIISLLCLLVVWVGGCFMKGNRLVDTIDTPPRRLSGSQEETALKNGNDSDESDQMDEDDKKLKAKMDKENKENRLNNEKIKQKRNNEKTEKGGSKTIDVIIELE